MEVAVMNVQIKIVESFRNLAQSVTALSLNLVGIAAGLLLAFYLDVFSVTSWSLLLFPGILSVRGSIGGLFCGRLSTALHLGTVKPSIRKNTECFHLIISEVITLTMVISLVMGFFSSILNILLFGHDLIDSLPILATVMTTMGLSIIFIFPITVGVSVLSFKKGLDPDVVVYPIISTISDILVTICYILALKTYFISGKGSIIISFFAVIFLLLGSNIMLKNRTNKLFIKVMKESFITLVIVAFIVNFTGLILGEISNLVGKRPEIYIIYPALIDTVGDVGSIVGSTATTMLALGSLKPSFSSIKRHLNIFNTTWIASLVIFMIFVLVSWIPRVAGSQYGLLSFAGQIFITNILAVPIIGIISFVVAVNISKKGWDPDNFVIPIESSLADSITTLALLLALHISI